MATILGPCPDKDNSYPAQWENFCTSPTALPLDGDCDPRTGDTIAPTAKLIMSAVNETNLQSLIAGNTLTDD